MVCRMNFSCGDELHSHSPLALPVSTSLSLLLIGCLAVAACPSSTQWQQLAVVDHIYGNHPPRGHFWADRTKTVAQPRSSCWAQLNTSLACWIDAMGELVRWWKAASRLAAAASLPASVLKRVTLGSLIHSPLQSIHASGTQPRTKQTLVDRKRRPGNQGDASVLSLLRAMENICWED